MSFHTDLIQSDVHSKLSSLRGYKRRMGDGRYVPAIEKMGTDHSWVYTNANQIAVGRDNNNTWEIGNQTDISLNSRIRFYRPSDGTAYTKFHHFTSYGQGSSYYLNHGAGQRAVATAIDGIQLVMQSGNINSGEFQLFGITK